MLERILGSLERESERELYSGVDPRGELLWSRKGRGILLAVGGWQETLERRGVRPGDRVAIDLPRGPDLLPAHLAVLSSGATVVPINPSLSGPERARVLERAEARTVLERDEPGELEAAPRLRPRDPATPALLIFTSGTTGEPKGVPLSLANLEANLAGLEKAWGLSRADRLLHVLPCHHVHGLVLALYGPARLGMPILLAERFIAEDCLHALAAQRTTLFMGVPTMFHRMAGVQHPLELPGMRLFVSGSAPLSEADFLAFEASFGQRPLERYGLSETLIVATNPLHGERRPGTVGHPLPGTQVRLARDGEIEVSGPGVMAGYWRASGCSEAPPEGFFRGFFRTGDLGSFDREGYLCVAGRKKELIIVGGSNVLPGEVERGLAGAAGVEELAAAGQPDDDHGETVAVFVVATVGTDTADLELRLREQAEQNLATYKRPRTYRFLDRLPRNAMGKIDRRALPI